MIPLETIAIIGAGLMGHGLALVFARAGHAVTVTDTSSEALASVRDRVAASLEGLGEDAAAVERIATAASAEAAVANAGFVIEAVSENLALKQDLFARMDRVAPPQAILASNTSVIPIGAIAAQAEGKHRILGTHWWNPPYLVPLVEVIQAEHTAADAVARAMAMMTALGKTPVHVKKDVPGFVGNRLQHALWREAIALVADGVCDAKTVDLVVKAGFGRRLAVLGPLENADMVGTDLTLAIQDIVLKDLNRSTEASPYVRALAAEGKLGFKTGEGFRPWTEEGKAELRAAVRDHLMLLLERGL